MAERDRFEVDLTAALLAYLEDAPTQVRPVELARHFAAAYPHGRSGIRLWRPLAVPSPAWVPLLVAALVTALLAGTMFVGSQLQRNLPAVVPPVQPGSVCPTGSNPDRPGPADQARPPEAGPMAFDRTAGQIVMLEGADTWTFDVCSNTWTLMQSGSGRPTGLALVYDPGADFIIGVDYPEHPVASPPHAWVYSLADNTWTRKGPAPEYVARLWYDAASGQVAAWAAASDEEPGTVWTYDVASDAWAAVGELEVLGGYGWNTPGDLLAYDASLDRVVATVIADMSGTSGGVPTRLVDTRAGSVVGVTTLAPWAGACSWFVSMYCYGGIAGAAIAYDEHAERTVVLIGGNLFAFDAAADRWDTLYGPGDTSDAVASSYAVFGALARESSSMVSDPLNGRLVVLGGAGDAVLAFDTTSREWTVLLDPSKAQATPTP